MVYTKLLTDIWSDFYNPTIEIMTTINKFFHDDYEQCVNGAIMGRNEYVQHVIEQRKNMVIDAIDYRHILEKEHELFALYYLRGKNSGHLPIEAEVVAYFRFENQKIITIQGLARSIKSDLGNVDIFNADFSTRKKEIRA